ncbi:MAG: 6-phosphogluconolactonase, partial [Gammaproteobacteria bacterium]|nr:6-phosphogluconolactonase [Gammaproteobacteria bacterium]
MDGEADPEMAARQYEALLPDALDLVILGMGADGHTASLFPDSDALQELTRRVLAVTGPKPPTGRLTLTPVALGAARRRVLLIRGSDKARHVAQSLTADAWNPHLP